MGTALGSVKVTFKVAPERVLLDEMTARHGNWLTFELGRAGPAQAAMAAIGQPIPWGQARCLSLSYRATLQPLVWAVGFNGNRAHQIVWPEFLASDPAKTPLGKLGTVEGFSASPMGAALLAVADSCNIPLDV